MSARPQIRLPTLPSAPTGIAVDLAAGRGPRVIAVVHSASCTPCMEFIRQLDDAAESIAEWGGRVAVVACEKLEQVTPIHESVSAGFQVLADPNGKLDLAAPAVLVADEWGEVYLNLNAGSQHAFPTPDEIAEWVRFIAIQCPECEPPEGEWKNI